MAFPVVAARASGASTAGVNTTSHPITLPSGISAGNLLLVVFSSDGSPTIGIDTGASGNNWQTIGPSASGANETGAVFWKVAEGSDALTVTTSNSEQSSHISFRITGADTVTGSVTNSSSTNSNPPSHTTTMPSQDILWIATRTGDDVTVATAAPANYGNLQTITATAAAGASTNTAERELAATTEDPGVFTSTNEQWACFTLAVGSASVSGSLSLSADAGSHILTGTAASTLRGLVVAGDAGGYAITGADATTLAVKAVAAASASYAVNGTDASALAGKAVAADAGSLAISGTDAALTKTAANALAAGTGSHTITGTDADALKAALVSAGAGDYAIVGSDATPTLAVGYTLGAEAGAYEITGTDAGFIRSYAVDAEAGSYAITGSDASTTATALEPEAVPIPPARGGGGRFYSASSHRSPRKKKDEPKVVTVVVAEPDGERTVVPVPAATLKPELKAIAEILDGPKREIAPRMVLQPNDDDEVLRIMELLAEMEDDG